jgi:uncharacterized protein YceK
MNQVKNILGFHSPAREGPGSDADTWAPNLVKMFASGIEGGAGDARTAAHSVISGVKGALTSGGASGSVSITGIASATATQAAAGAAAAAVMAGGGGAGQPIQLVLDNGAMRVLATALLPYQVQGIRNAVGIRNK